MRPQLWLHSSEAPKLCEAYRDVSSYLPRSDCTQVDPSAQPRSFAWSFVRSLARTFIRSFRPCCISFACGCHTLPIPSFFLSLPPSPPTSTSTPSVSNAFPLDSTSKRTSKRQTGYGQTVVQHQFAIKHARKENRGRGQRRQQQQ